SGMLTGERRQVTAFFYDIVGSTALLQQLGAEEFGTMQLRLHDLAASLIEARDGFLDQVQGDGGCAYFGFPESSEDAAQSAVGVALELIDRCRQLAAETEIDLAVRVGVATGVVVIARQSNRRIPGQTEFIGIAPTLAARLQAEAAPGTAAVADSTFR